MNLIEKILAGASGRERVAPGDVVVARVDHMVLHDLSSNFVSRVFEEELKGEPIADPSRIIIVFDHNFSPATEQAAQALFNVRRFAARHGITNLFDCGSGSLHHVVIENGLWAPGEIITGCDSHTTIYGALGLFSTGIGNNSMAGLGFRHGMGWFRVPQTIQVVFHGEPGEAVTARDVSQFLVGHLGEEGAVYKAVEYAGPYIESLSVEDRLLFPLMAIDIGAKTGFINPDEKTVEFAKRWSRRKDFEVLKNDRGTTYEKVMEIEVSQIEPQVACPPTVGNVKPIREAEGVEIQVAEVGGSTGGRLQDIRDLAGHLRGKRVHPRVRLQVVPATRGIYRAAAQEGLLEILLDAGAIIFPPSAGSNQAVNMGALGEEEAILSTQARNFPGRNGHPKARHYLASVHTVAASALSGRISDPRQFPLP